MQPEERKHRHLALYSSTKSRNLEEIHMQVNPNCPLRGGGGDTKGGSERLREESINPGHWHSMSYSENRHPLHE